METPLMAGAVKGGNAIDLSGFGNQKHFKVKQYKESEERLTFGDHFFWCLEFLAICAMEI